MVGLRRSFALLLALVAIACRIAAATSSADEAIEWVSPLLSEGHNEPIRIAILGPAGPYKAMQGTLDIVNTWWGGGIFVATDIFDSTVDIGIYPFILPSYASEAEYEAAMQLVREGRNSSGHLVGLYNAVFNTVKSQAVVHHFPQAASEIGEGTYLYDCGLEDLQEPWPGAPNGNGLAISMLPKIGDSAKHLHRYSKTIGLQDVLIVSTTIDPYLRRQATGAVQTAFEEGLTVVGPSVAWCDAMSSLTETCAVVSINGQTTCRCFTAVELVMIASAQTSSLYEVVETNLLGGINGYVGDMEARGFLNRTNPEALWYALKIFEDVSSMGAEIDLYVNLAFDYAAFHHALYYTEMMSIEIGRAFSLPSHVAGWYGDLDIGFLHEKPWFNGSYEFGYGDWISPLNESMGDRVIAIGHENWDFQRPYLLMAYTIIYGPWATFQWVLEWFSGEPLSKQAVCVVEGLGVMIWQITVSMRPGWSRTTEQVRHESFTDSVLRQMRPEDSNKLASSGLSIPVFWPISSDVLFDETRNNRNGLTVHQAHDLRALDGGRPILPFSSAFVPEVQAPFGSWSSLNGCRLGEYNTGRRCVVCPAGRYAPVAAKGTLEALPLPMEETCLVCPNGLATAEPGMSECQPCPPGFFSLNDTQPIGQCRGCSPGTAQESSGQSRCELCDTGFFEDQEGSSRCQECVAGRFQQKQGQSYCDLCSKGTFQNESAAVECDMCPRGSYSEEMGQASCASCEDHYAGSTTVTSRSTTRFECVCPFGTFDPRAYGSSLGKCMPCDTKALHCPGNAPLACPFSPDILWQECYEDVESQVLMEPVRMPIDTVLKGFTSKVLDSVSVDDSNVTGGQRLVLGGRLDLVDTGVWECRSVKACPGQPAGNPAARTCADGNVGYGCGECAAGKAPDLALECTDCTPGLAELLLTCMAVGFFIVAGSLAYGWNQTSRSDEALMQASAIPVFYVTVWGLQLCGLLSNMNFRWPTGLLPLLNACQLALLDMRVMRVGCLLDENTFASHYLFRQIVPLLLFLLVAVWFFISRVVEKVRGGKPKRLSLQALVNAMGVLLEWGYVSLLATAVAPFLCRENPNGQDTVVAYAFVECGSDAWTAMVPIAVLTILVYGVGIYALYASICITAPFRMQYKRFRTWTRFITQQVHPAVWWYHMVLLTKCLLVTIAPVLFPSNGHKQMLVVVGTLLVTLCVHLSYNPYNTRAANRLEAWSLCFLVVVMMLGSFFIFNNHGSTGYDESLLTVALSVILWGIVIAMLLTATWMMVTNIILVTKAKTEGRKDMIKKMLPGLRSTSAVLSAASDQQVMKLLGAISYQDLYHFDMVTRFTLTELCGFKSKSFERLSASNSGLSKKVTDNAALQDAMQEARKSLARQASNMTSSSQGSSNTGQFYTKGSIVWV